MFRRRQSAGLGQRSLLPFDGQQPLAEHPIAVAALGGPGSHAAARARSAGPCRARPARRGRPRTPAASGCGHPRVAVAGVAGRTVGTQPAHTQRQQQAATAAGLDAGVSGDGLETGIQQRRVHAVGALLEADRTGQRDLGQHGADSRVRGVRGGQTGERRTVTGYRARRTDSRNSVPSTRHGCAASRAAMSYAGGWASSSAACRAAVARRVFSPSWWVSTAKSTTPGASTDATASIGVWSSSSSICSKRMSRTSDASPRTVRGRGQRHLAVGGPGKGGHVVYLVIAQPGQCRGADLGLPHVALRLLGQPHMRAQQRMHSNRAATLRLLCLGRRGRGTSGRWVQAGSGASTSRPAG